MLQITQCTACNRQLAVPSAAGTSTRLECPLCHAEFTLADTPVITVPDVILLDQDQLGFEMALEERCGLGDVGPAYVHQLEEGIDVSEIEEVLDDPSGDARLSEDAANGPALDASMEEPELWDFEESADEQQQVAVGPAIRQSDPVAARMIIRTNALSRKRKSALRQLVGFVGGGAIGLVLGYYILLWIGGQEHDFLKLGDKLPVWMVPAEFYATEPEVAETRDSISDYRQETSQDDNTDIAREPGSQQEGTTDEIRSAEEAVSTDATSLAENEHNHSANPEINDPGTAITEPPAHLGLRDVMPVTSDGLAAAIDAATAARDQLIEGDLSDKAIQPKKGKSYIAYCKLAEALTGIVDTGEAGLGSDQNTAKFQSTDWQPHYDAARELLVETTRSKKTRHELGTIAQIWLDNQKRDNQGIVLFGRVIGPYQCPPYSGLQFAFNDVPRTIPIVSSEPLSYQEGDRIVVIGTIIDNPADRLLSFTETPPRIIYTHMILKAD